MAIPRRSTDLVPRDERANVHYASLIRAKWLEDADRLAEETGDRHLAYDPLIYALREGLRAAIAHRDHVHSYNGHDPEHCEVCGAEAAAAIRIRREEDPDAR